MKLQNKIIEKYGIESVLHFLVGALLVSLVSAFGLLYFNLIGFIIATFIMIPVVYGISYYKEKRLDDRYESSDIRAAMLGVGIVVILNLLLLITKLYVIKSVI